MFYKFILLTLSIAAFSSCSHQTVVPTGSTNHTIQPNIKCSATRPEICAHDYRPVCAERDTQVRCIKAPCPASELKTYSNACRACADPKVMSYQIGSCETTQTKP